MGIKCLKVGVGGANTITRQEQESRRLVCCGWGVSWAFVNKINVEIMADDSIAAQREARRRRILQNSQARLERITGRPTRATQVKQVSTNEYRNGPLELAEDEDLSQPATSSSVDYGNYAQCSREDNSDDECSNHGNSSRELFSKYSQGDNLTTADGHANFHTTNSGASPEETRELQINPPKQISMITTLKIHLLLLALLVRLLYYFELGFVFGESIFVPFIVVEASHLLVVELLCESAVSTGIIGAVMLLSGFSPERVHRFTKIFGLASRIGSDFAVYFVTFVLFHCAIEELS